MTNQTISIDEAKFKKTSKKLLSQLEEKPLLSLSLVQEILAKSLGFRNLNDLQKIFSEKSHKELEEKSIDLHKKTNFFESVELEQAIHIISILMEPNNNADMWRSRAHSLLVTIMRALIYMRDQKEIILNVEFIREYLTLDKIIKLYKTRLDFPPHIHKDLKIYLLSLPGFQESAPKQSSTTYEQHGYLQMQFSGALSHLKIIEEKDFVIADKKWFIYSEQLKSLSLNPTLLDLDFVEDSWIGDTNYIAWLNLLNKKGKFQIIKLSDLLIYITTIMLSEKRNAMCNLLTNIVNNYSMAYMMSNKIQNEVS